MRIMRSEYCERVGEECVALRLLQEACDKARLFFGGLVSHYDVAVTVIEATGARDLPVRRDEVEALEADCLVALKGHEEPDGAVGASLSMADVHKAEQAVRTPGPWVKLHRAAAALVEGSARPQSNAAGVIVQHACCRCNTITRAGQPTKHADGCLVAALDAALKVPVIDSRRPVVAMEAWNQALVDLLSAAQQAHHKARGVAAMGRRVAEDGVLTDSEGSNGA